MIREYSARQARSLQVEVGPSEIGSPCKRQVAYRIAGVAKRELKDAPFASLVGGGVHLVMDDVVGMHPGRFVTNVKVATQSGLFGTIDLYDREHDAIVDWKSVSDASLKVVRQGGAQPSHLAQIRTYGLAWGNTYSVPPRLLRIVYLPRSGQLKKAIMHEELYDQQTAVETVRAFHALEVEVEQMGPAAIPPTPSWLDCTYCSYRRPGPVDDEGCPGGI